MRSVWALDEGGSSRRLPGARGETLSRSRVVGAESFAHAPRGPPIRRSPFQARSDHADLVAHYLAEIACAVLLEDYGLIGDLEAAALVGRTGAVDWLRLPQVFSHLTLILAAGANTKPTAEQGD
jgi:hypothetical protein